MFPLHRMRRYRRTNQIRELFAEHYLHKDALIQPVFIRSSLSAREIVGFPGIFRYTIDELLSYTERLLNRGLNKFLLFEVPSEKVADTEHIRPKLGVKAVKELRRVFRNDLVLFADVCLCPYQQNGHCGVVVQDTIDNDATLKVLGRLALEYAEAGVDGVAPSGMMDGQVAYIREKLNEAGMTDVLIMSYSTKFSSNLYGPFRNAAGSSPAFGDRKSYQLDYRVSRQAVREALIDEEEGADILMVKPGIFYLDILKELRNLTRLPIAVYNVSGEYTMLKALVEQGLAEERELVEELLTAFFRAGADIVITYFAEEVVSW